jgi:hypothetical protein
LVPSRQQVRIELREIASEPVSVRCGDATPTWRYDADHRRLVVDLRERASSQVIDLSMG